MKKLDKFILKAFIGPFFGILLIVVFILIMQSLWLYIDELVGKGLGIKVILEFLMWASLTLLPLSLPLATLLASVMTIGQMSENNELIAMKSAGLSLSRVMRPLFISSLFIVIGAFFAANNLVPLSYNQIYTLRDDIKNTKEEINIPSGIFYDGIDGYILRIGSKDDKTGMMHEVMLYDHTGEKGNTSITLADSALMKMSKAKDYLTFSMYSGENYQETNNIQYKDTTLQLEKITFEKQEMIIPLENYAFQKSSGARYGDQTKAMKLAHLKIQKDSLSIQQDSMKNVHAAQFAAQRLMRYNDQLDTSFDWHSRRNMDKLPSKLRWDNVHQERACYEDALSNIDQLYMDLENYESDSYQISWILKKTKIEMLKKFSQALMCLILFLIGAPLGAFIRKGGLGVSAIIAVLFFVFYWVIDITGTKLAQDGAVSALIGTSVSTIVLLPIGLFLTYKAINDSVLFNTDSFKTWWRMIKSKVMRVFRKTRIVYMGTPEFAVAPLDALVKEGYKVVGVVTVADKPSGRGLKVNESAVKKYAVEHEIPVLQPLKLKDPEFLSQLAAFKADLFVVVAFRMLPEEVWSMPPLGTFNLHAALLPQYRGAAPINWAVINGEKMTGATTFMIDKDIDTGGIMLRQECKISPEDTAGDIHDRLMPIGAELVVQTVEGIIQKNIETRVQRSFIQGSEVLKPAPKLTRELCHIDWNDSVKNIYNLIRGLSPYPTAYTEIVKEGGNPLQMKIFSAEKIEGDEFAALGKDIVPGTMISDGKNLLAIAAKDGAISIKDLQISGKKRMDVKSFLLGFRESASYSTTAGTSKAEVDKTRV